MKLLIIEDETRLSDTLRQRFERELGAVVDTADNAREGRWLWDEYEYDLVILDLGLPGENGLSLLKEKRLAGDLTPVLVLTARNAWKERVIGLKAGADDYLGKPFHFEELLARVEALIRRRMGQADNCLQAGDVTLDMDRRRLRVGEKVFALSRTEFRLLSLLLEKPGRVYSKAQILSHLYPHDLERDEGVVEVYIHALRKRLGRERIVNVRGQGYYFDVAPETEESP